MSDRSARVRKAGWIVLVCGIAGACLFYWMQTRTSSAALDELVAGYERARERNMGIMMGTLGVQMTQWMEAFEQPGLQAVLIAAGSTLIAAICFRVAWLMDLPPTDERRWPTD